MKKAKIVLIALVLFAGAGGTLAFKVSRLPLEEALSTTKTIFTTVGNIVYSAAYEEQLGDFCTVMPHIYITSASGLWAKVYRSTTNPEPRKIIFSATDGSGAKITTLVPVCTLTRTQITMQQ
jgi:hypothetical protein